MQGTGAKLDESFILVIARETAKGLKAIHNAGIIHRDVKGEVYCQISYLQKAVLKAYSYMESEADRPCLV